MPSHPDDDPHNGEAMRHDLVRCLRCDQRIDTNNGRMVPHYRPDSLERCVRVTRSHRMLHFARKP